MKKRILLIGHEASRTGAPIVLLNITEILNKSGYELKILLKQGGALYLSYVNYGECILWNTEVSELTTVEKILFRLKGGIKARQNKIVEKLKNWEPDLIFNNTIATGELVENLAVIGSPIVSMIHELETVIKLFNSDRGSEKVLMFSKKIIPVSESVKNNLIENHKVDEERIEVIYAIVKPLKPVLWKENIDIINGVKILDNFYFVGSCGNLLLRKGFDFFIELATKAKKRGLNELKFLWVGGNQFSGTFIEIEQELIKKNLTDSVFFVGEKENLYHYYSLFDVFFLSSREDPFPLVMLEAAQFDLPIVGFKKSGGVEEFLEQGGGFLADYGDTEQVLDFILKIWENKALYEKCSREVKQALDRFDPEEAKKKLLALIESMIS